MSPERRIETPAVDPMALAEAIAVHVPKLPIKQASPGHRYWVGLLESCPFHVIHVAGVDFHKFIDPPALVNDSWERQQKAGKIVTLTDEQVEKIKTGIVKKYIRRIGKNKTYMHSTDSINYNPQANDEPVAMYAYLMRVPETAPAKWRPAQEPVAMLAKDEAKG